MLVVGERVRLRAMEPDVGIETLADLAVVDENEAARRVCTKVGFRGIGRARQAFRRAGRLPDMVLTDLLEPDLVRRT